MSLTLGRCFTQSLYVLGAVVLLATVCLSVEYRQYDANDVNVCGHELIPRHTFCSRAGAHELGLSRAR